MEAAIKVLQLYEANYPEFLHKVFIVNGRLHDNGSGSRMTSEFN